VEGEAMAGEEREREKARSFGGSGEWGLRGVSEAN
jgi:hypothetical protein